MRKFRKNQYQNKNISSTDLKDRSQKQYRIYPNTSADAQKKLPQVLMRNVLTIFGQHPYTSSSVLKESGNREAFDGSGPFCQSPAISGTARGFVALGPWPYKSATRLTGGQN